MVEGRERECRGHFGGGLGFGIGNDNPGESPRRAAGYPSGSRQGGLCLDVPPDRPQSGVTRPAPRDYLPTETLTDGASGAEGAPSFLLSSRPTSGILSENYCSTEVTSRTAQGGPAAAPDHLPHDQEVPRARRPAPEAPEEPPPPPVPEVVREPRQRRRGARLDRELPRAPPPGAAPSPAAPPSAPPRPPQPPAPSARPPAPLRPLHHDRPAQRGRPAPAPAPSPAPRAETLFRCRPALTPGPDRCRTSLRP